MDLQAIPDSWAATNLGSIVDYGKTQKCELADIDGATWVVELEDIEKNTSRIISRGYTPARNFKSSKNKFNKGDILYGKLRPYLNKVVMADENGVCSTEIIPINAEPLVSNKYIFYWLKSHCFLDYVNDVSYGVNMPRLGTNDGLNAPFILAPLAEQKEIADRLDTLLVQVEATQTRLARIPEMIKRFRQSVLTDSTSGKLTKKWREEQQLESSTDESFRKKIFNEWIHSKEREFVRKGKSPKNNNWKNKLGEPKVAHSEIESWKVLSLECVAEVLDPNPSHRMPQYVQVGIPFISTENIIDFNTLDFSKGKKITEDELTRQRERYEVTTESFAFTRIGSIGRSVNLPLPHNYGVSHAMAIITPFESLVGGDYIKLIMSCESILQQANDGVQSVGVPDLGIGKMKAFQIPVPTMSEQTEIVRRVEQLFAYADTIEQQTKAAKARVDNLTQAILAKAFRGELTADWRAANPDFISGNNSAAALLARIQAERATTGGKRKKLALKQ